MISITDRQKRVAARVGLLVAAALVLAGMWKFAGAGAAIFMCLFGTGMLVLYGIKRAGKRKTETIFGFYVTAEEILGANGSSRYRFEIAEAIKTGETVVHMLPDPPPLSSFALGALYHSIGDHNGAIGHLALAAEEELLKESPHVSPSRQLRRYVRRLRQIERRPERWPKISAAIRNLETVRRDRAAHLLAENQVQLKRLVEAFDSKLSDESAQATLTRTPVTDFAGRSFKSITPPPPISEVLNDVYQEEKPS
ncbi:MAG TPA: hypothetical protein VEW46_00155 [Pyrinomonadaceae bacterium]|nr:hypothetical protein [Pyrinomonadaceae bacterium]